MINGTVQHFMMGVALIFFDLLIFQEIKTAIAVMITVELVQADMIGWYLMDTLHDLLANLAGGVLGWVIYTLLVI